MPKTKKPEVTSSFDRVTDGPHVAEQKRVEAALRESEERFRRLADNIAQLAWMADPSGWLFWYNRRWFEFTGTTLEQMQGWGWQKVHHPDEVLRVTEKFRRCLATGEFWEDTFPLRCKDGQYRWFLSRAIPIRDDSGAVVRWFGTNTDITELREAQEALREADRRKSEFLAVLSHELRNPLAPIRNAVYILEQAEPGGEQARRAVAIIDRQVSHMARLVDDLLDVTRITRGKIPLRCERMELNPVVQSAGEDLRELFSERGIALDIAVTKEPLYAHADRTRIAQVVGNLLQNAAKFNPAGGRARLSLERGSAAEAVIVVCDDGPGIAAELREQLFEPFVQAAQTLDRSRGGLGLGLALVKGLVELHGGTVRLDSEGAGKGAVFTVRLPLESLQGAGESPRRPA